MLRNYFFFFSITIEKAAAKVRVYNFKFKTFVFLHLHLRLVVGKTSGKISFKNFRRVHVLRHDVDENTVRVHVRYFFYFPSNVHFLSSTRRQ